MKRVVWIVQEVVPDINTLDLDTSTRSIERAIAFVRDLLERVPTIRDAECRTKRHS